MPERFIRRRADTTSQSQRASSKRQEDIRLVSEPNDWSTAMTRTISRTTATLAATLSIALLGLATSVAESVMREAHAGASAASHPRAAENASARGAYARAWDDLPPP